MFSAGLPELVGVPLAAAAFSVLFDPEEGEAAPVPEALPLVAVPVGEADPELVGTLVATGMSAHDRFLFLRLFIFMRVWLWRSAGMSMIKGFPAEGGGVCTYKLSRLRHCRYPPVRRGRPWCCRRTCPAPVS